MNNQSGWDADLDMDRTPVASSSRPASYVPAAPMRRPDPLAALWQPAPSGVVDAWQPQRTIVETATPIQRAGALVMRQLLLWCIWLVLAVAAALAAWQFARIGGGLAALFGLAVFGGCAAASFIALDRAERADSATGLEKHRIEQAARLERLKLQQDHELKRAALEAYLEHLDKIE
jgi:hypothetical protein